MTTTKQLAEYLVSSRAGDIPADVQSEALRALVNIIGCAMGGAPDPATEIALKTFMPFSGPADAGLVRSKAGLSEYTDEAVNDPVIRRVRESAVASANSSIIEDAVDVEVELNDGRILRKRLEHSLGNLKRPLSNDQLSDKFRDQAVQVLSVEKVERLIDLSWNIAKLKNVADLIEASRPIG